MNIEKDNKERQMRDKEILLFIDDDPVAYRGLRRVVSSINSLDFVGTSPRYFDSYTTEQMQRTTLVIADQFFGLVQPMLTTRDFLAKIKEANPSVTVVESSYAPFGSVYPGSIGSIDTLWLNRLVNEKMNSWPKNAWGFIRNLKYEASGAFKEARRVEMALESEEAEQIIDSSYRKIFTDTFYKKFLEISNTTEQQFVQTFAYEKDPKKRLLILHCTWQILSSLAVLEKPEDLAGMYVQRLKENLRDKDESLYIAPPESEN